VLANVLEAVVSVTDNSVRMTRPTG